MHPGRYLQCPEDTQYTTLHHLHSRGRLDTARIPSMDQNLGLLGLRHMRDMMSTLRQSVILQDRHSLLHHTVLLDRRRYHGIQMDSVYTHPPQTAHNTQRHTVCTV